MRAVNLLPADLRGAVKAPVSVTPAPEESGGSTGAFFALGALALCVLAIAGYVLTTNEIKQQQADLDQLTARSEVVMREANSLKPYADFQSMAQGRIATVKELASQRFDWERALRDLARVIPADVTVKKLSGSVSADAGSDSPLRGAISAPAVTIDGCTSDQEGVARLMARLRAASGVTRVSLAKSSKVDAAAAAAGDAAPAPTAEGQAGCSGKGKDQAPDFQVVAFFEGDAVATATTAGTPGSSSAPLDAAAAGGTPTAAADPQATPTPAADGSATPVSTTKGPE